jgi:predicted nucleic acid-binding protein
VILVDTSIWIDHLRSPLSALTRALAEDRVLMHPYIQGELALGTLRNRRGTMADLIALPTAPKVADEAVMALIETGGLVGSGVGYIDCHLLASAQLVSVQLWTSDRRLHRAAVKLGLAEGGGA